VTEAQDIRDRIFDGIADARVTFAVTAQRNGILAGMSRACDKAAELGVTVLYSCEDGMRVAKDEKVLVAAGTPKQVALAEEVLVGLLAKTSGIATAADRAVRLAQGRVQVVSGAWKKMPPELKTAVREAVVLGGASSRIADCPFVYLDKNYVAILGGIEPALRAVEEFPDTLKVIQLKGTTADMTVEAEQAVRGGAGILMVDTGDAAAARAVSASLEAAGLRARARIAFAGGIAIDDIPSLVTVGIDILDIGADIVDAPLLDLRLDVVEVIRPGEGPDVRHELNLLDKTELWIDDIRLQDANLTDLAHVVAGALGLEAGEVLVVDVREGHVTLDVLRRAVQARDIAGKEAEVLLRLGRLPGVSLGENARLHSEGILGLIALPAEDVDEVLGRSERVLADVRSRVARRAKVFASGAEVKDGSIQDTNTPLIVERLRERGFEASGGGILTDDAESIALSLESAAGAGYGLVITTGGVGAEEKDCTIEALLRVDAGAATPWVVKYQRGSGRHVKEGVRVGVGQLGSSYLVALPGPNDEVNIALDALVESLPFIGDKRILAEKIAAALRGALIEKSRGFHHHCGLEV